MLDKNVDMKEDTEKICDTETLILQAAEREFLAKGFSGAKTTVIAEAAGVTHAMLHYYFRTKEKLFEKILTSKMERVGDILLGAIGSKNGSLRERLVDGIETHFDFLVANPDLPRFILNVFSEQPERMALLRDNFLEKASQLFADLQKDLDAHSENTGCERTAAPMLLLDIVSLNLFPFVASPVVGTLICASFGDMEQFLKMRKEENVRTILKKLNLD